MNVVILMLALAGGATPVPAVEDRYEPPPTLGASELLAPELLKGSEHEVEERVQTDGFWAVYRVSSRFGVLEAVGEVRLRVRIREIEALVALSEVSGGEAMVKAAGESAAHTAGAVGTAVTRPGETVAGVGSGMKRAFGRFGRKAKRSKEKGQESQKDDDADERGAASEADPDTTEAADEDGSDQMSAAAKAALGVSKSQRVWAQKLGVDPYTDNELLRKELKRVAGYDSAGRLTTKLLTPPVLKTTASVSNLVWQKDPDELLTLNEQRLREMGVSPEDSRVFRYNELYRLSDQTIIVGSLFEMTDVPGRAELIARIGAADRVEAATFFGQLALLLRLLHERHGPIGALLPDTAGAAWLSEDRVVQIVPADHLSWTPLLDDYLKRAGAIVASAHRGARPELWIAGGLTAAARAGIESAGWLVVRGELADEFSKASESGGKR